MGVVRTIKKSALFANNGSKEKTNEKNNSPLGGKLIRAISFLFNI